MKISVVIPAHNEKGNLRELIEQLVVSPIPEESKIEIVLVDDNSSDGTGTIVDSLENEYEFIRVIHRKGKPGFGLALREGFKAATGDIIIPFMADFSDDFNDIPKLLQKISEGYDVAFGSRFINGGQIEDYPFLKLLCNRAFNIFVRTIFKFEIRDVTNAFKAYKKEVLQQINIESTGFEICAEIPIKAYINSYKMVEVPTTWSGRKRGIAKFSYGKMGWPYLSLAIRLWRRWKRESEFKRARKKE